MSLNISLPDADILLLIGQLVLIGVVVGVDHARRGAVVVLSASGRCQCIVVAGNLGYLLNVILKT